MHQAGPSKPIYDDAWKHKNQIRRLILTWIIFKDSFPIAQKTRSFNSVQGNNLILLSELNINIYILWEGPRLSLMCNLVERVITTIKLLLNEPFWLFSSFFKISCEVEVWSFLSLCRLLRCGGGGHSSFLHYVTMSGQLHASSALSGEMSRRYPLDSRLVEPQNCLDALETGNLLLLPGIELRSVGFPAHT